MVIYLIRQMIWSRHKPYCTFQAKKAIHRASQWVEIIPGFFFINIIMQLTFHKFFFIKSISRQNEEACKYVRIHLHNWFQPIAIRILLSTQSIKFIGWTFIPSFIDSYNDWVGSRNFEGIKHQKIQGIQSHFYWNIFVRQRLTICLHSFRFESDENNFFRHDNRKLKQKLSLVESHLQKEYCNKYCSIPTS